MTRNGDSRTDWPLKLPPPSWPPSWPPLAPAPAGKRSAEGDRKLAASYRFYLLKWRQTKYTTARVAANRSLGPLFCLSARRPLGANLAAAADNQTSPLFNRYAVAPDEFLENAKERFLACVFPIPIPQPPASWRN